MEEKTSVSHFLKRKKGLTIILLTLLLIAVVCTSFLLTRSTPLQTKSVPTMTLGMAAAAKGRVFGAAVASSHLNEPEYANTLDSEFTGVTPENEMKWETTEPARGTFNFAPADAIVNHALNHDMKIRGHTLVWYSQLAPWVSEITSGTELLQVMQDHIAGEVGHFKGKIWYWDVVNEAFNDDGSRRDSIFQQLIGDRYIEEAFKAAHAADPQAKLCYNDYSTEGINAKSTAILNMVHDFKSRDIPIDCVGFQFHLNVGEVPDDLLENLQRFADAGVDVQITELDIRLLTPASTEDLQQQARNYGEVVAACLKISRCTDITTWGITDKYSWIPEYFSGQGDALLFDENYQKKPAYSAVLQALG